MDFFLPPNNSTSLVIIRIEIRNDKPCYIVCSNSSQVIDRFPAQLLERNNKKKKRFLKAYLLENNTDFLISVIHFRKFEINFLSNVCMIHFLI